MLIFWFFRYLKHAFLCSISLSSVCITWYIFRHFSDIFRFDSVYWNRLYVYVCGRLKYIRQSKYRTDVYVCVCVQFLLSCLTMQADFIFSGKIFSKRKKKQTNPLGWKHNSFTSYIIENFFVINMVDFLI